MNRKRWRKIEPIIDKALAMEETEKKETYLEKIRKQDKELHHQATNLLRFIQKAKETKFLENY